MKIAEIVPGLGIGGAERIACGLCDHLVSHGHEVTLFCLTDKVLQKPRNAAVSVQTYNLSKHHPMGWVSGFRQFRHDLRAFAPDVIHSHLIHGNLFGRLANATLRGALRPLVSTIHNNCAPKPMAAWLYQLTDGLSVRTVAVSEDARAVFVRAGACPPAKSAAIPNGIEAEAKHRPLDTQARRDLRARLGAADTDVLFVAIGRAVWEKDYPCMVKAFEIARRQDARLKLAIIGGGPELRRMRAECHTLGLSDHITLLGEQAEARRYLAAADAFISTSTIEGFGLAIGEAMAEGLPVIAPRTGGVPDMVGDTGWLCSPSQPALFAKLVAEVARLAPEDRLLVGKRAKTRIRDGFSESAMHRAWEALLGDLAAQPPSPQDNP